MIKSIKSLSFTLFFSFIYVIQGFGQNSGLDSLCNCSQILKTKSYFWKNDSLANNGYRLCSAETLTRCKLDKIDKRYLIENLGKPNRVERSNQGVEYIYYYYDYRKLPKASNPSKVVYYLSFHFNDEKGFVKEIEDGHYD